MLLTFEIPIRSDYSKIKCCKEKNETKRRRKDNIQTACYGASACNLIINHMWWYLAVCGCVHTRANMSTITVVLFYEFLSRRPSI